MLKKRITFDEMAKAISEQISGADKYREEQLKTLLKIKEVKAKNSEAEKLRLTDKLGEKHERVKTLEAKIDYTKNVIRNLKLEIKKEEIPSPETDLGAWIAHGVVVDKDIKGVGGLKVGIYEKKRPDRALITARTDEKGHFTIRCEKEKFKRILKEKAELYLKVMDRKRKVLHTTKYTVPFEPGRDEYFEIHLEKEVKKEEGKKRREASAKKKR